MPRKKIDTRGYLERLTFPKGLEKGFISSYISNIRLIALVVLSILAFGIFGFTQLSRRVNPEIEIPIIFVSTVLPGAGPEDIESLITVPIEDKLESIEGINTITSSSQDNVSAISIEFESNIDPDDAKADVQDAVDTVNDLPDDALDPNVVALDFEDVPVWTFAMTSKKDLPSLFRSADELTDRLEGGSYIKNALVTGLETQEIQIFIDPARAEEYSINPFAISQAVKQELDSFPAGTVSANNSEFSVTIDPVINSIDDIRSLRISIDDQTYLLNDIADVVERPTSNQPKSYIADSETSPERVITFSVFKLQSADIDEASQQAKDIVDEFRHIHNDQFDIISINDAGKDIADQFDELFQNLSVTIVLVFFTLFAFLGIKQASIASFSIPLTFMITFGIMLVSGLSINFLTMFSLILALGLVVDDAIVIISAMTSYYRTHKFTPKETGLLVWRDFIVPIWTTTLTTVWAFVPLLLSTGIIGEFIKSIPIVVSSVLLSSTAVAVLITLPLMIVVLKPRVAQRVINLLKIIGGVLLFAFLMSIFKGNPLAPLITIMILAVAAIGYRFRKDLTKDFHAHIDKRIDISKAEKWLHDRIFFGFVNPRRLSNKYESLITRILASQSLRRKTIVAVIILFVFSIILFPLGMIKNEFFPKTDEGLIYISLRMPSGTDIQTTDQEAQRILDDVRSTDGAEFVALDIGREVDTNSTSSESNANIARFTVKLLDEDERDRNSSEIAHNLREKLESYKSGYISVIEVSGGPPVGSDIQIKLKGEDLDALNQYADSVVEYLEDQAGVTNVDKSVKPGTSKISFIPDRDRLADVGLSVQDIGGWMRTYASGLDIDETSISSQDNQDIVFRMSQTKQSPESLSALTIPTQQGRVPLLSLGKLTLNPKPTRISREDGDRTLSVSASVEQGYNIPEISSELEVFAENELDLPVGYSWSTGGVNEENQASVNSILQAMVLAFILIFGTMVIQLNSYRKALVVLLVIPLAMSGVFIIFALTGTPLSFPALIGVLALYGIVVNNSIMVVEKINQNMAIDMPFDRAIADAAASRLEPIMFSSLTTIIGLLPITITDPLWRGLGGAIIAGLTFSGTIMLLFIPVVYYMIYSREGK